MTEPATMHEQIERTAQEIRRRDAVMKVKSVQFSHPVGIHDVRNRLHSVKDYKATEPGWKDWSVHIGGTSITLASEKAGRTIQIPLSDCIIEKAETCPRCGSFLDGRNVCPNDREGCKWPYEEDPCCPECRTTLKKGRKVLDHCQNPNCKWGWAPKSETDAEEAPAAEEVSA